VVFWIGILVGGLFAWLAFKLGFYSTWAISFNIVLAVYLGLLAGPVLIELVPAADTGAYGTGLAVLTTAAAAFVVLHCICYTFITGRFNVTFPSLLDNLGSVVLGFCVGFLVWSFIAFLVYISPIAKNNLARTVGFNRRARETVTANLNWWCGIVDRFTAHPNRPTVSKQIEQLLKNAHRTHDPNAPHADTPEPNQPR